MPVLQYARHWVPALREDASRGPSGRDDKHKKAPRKPPAHQTIKTLREAPATISIYTRGSVTLPPSRINLKSGDKSLIIATPRASNHLPPDHLRQIARQARSLSHDQLLQLRDLIDDSQTGSTRRTQN